MTTHWLQRNMHRMQAALVALALLFAPAQAVQAQAAQDVSTAAAPELTYGVRVGANFSGVSGDNIAIEESNMQPSVGAFLSLPLTNWLAVQPEVAYRPHDVKLSSDQGFSAQTWRYTTHYLAVPVLLKAYVPSPGASKLHLIAGPDVAFKLGGNVESAASQMEELPPAFGSEFSGTDVGAVVGAGFDQYAAGRVFSLDVRYKIGATDLVSDLDGASLYDRSFSITVGMGF